MTLKLWLFEEREPETAAVKEEDEMALPASIRTRPELISCSFHQLPAVALDERQEKR